MSFPYLNNKQIILDGELYAWGANGYGQLGLGFISGQKEKPTLVRQLVGIPIAFIACGGNHSFAITKSGAIFGWGKNLFGQLGLNDNRSRDSPVQLETLRSVCIRYIACGDDFSVFLTAEGRVLTCGSGDQLGNANDDLLPKMHPDLMGTTCTQIACGSRHVIAFEPSENRVLSFGNGESGQLGIDGCEISATPQIVNKYKINKYDQLSIRVRGIFSGGEHSFVTTFDKNDETKPFDYRIYK